jgi:hypothetical protein
MTSRFIPDEFDFDLSTLDSVLVVYKDVFGDGRGARLGMVGLRVWRGGCACAWVRWRLRIVGEGMGTRLESSVTGAGGSVGSAVLE